MLSIEATASVGTVPPQVIQGVDI